MRYSLIVGHKARGAGWRGWGALNVNSHHWPHSSPPLFSGFRFYVLCGRIENLGTRSFYTSYFALMNNCFCQAFCSVIIYTFKLFFVFRIHWIFKSFFCGSNFSKHHSLIRQHGAYQGNDIILLWSPVEIVAPGDRVFTACHYITVYRVFL